MIIKRLDKPKLYFPRRGN